MVMMECSILPRTVVSLLDIFTKSLHHREEVTQGHFLSKYNWFKFRVASRLYSLTLVHVPINMGRGRDLIPLQWTYSKPFKKTTIEKMLKVYLRTLEEGGKKKNKKKKNHKDSDT